MSPSANNPHALQAAVRSLVSRGTPALSSGLLASAGCSVHWGMNQKIKDLFPFLICLSSKINLLNHLHYKLVLSYYKRINNPHSSTILVKFNFSILPMKSLLSEADITVMKANGKHKGKWLGWKQLFKWYVGHSAPRVVLCTNLLPFSTRSEAGKPNCLQSCRPPSQTIKLQLCLPICKEHTLDIHSEK